MQKFMEILLKFDEILLEFSEVIDETGEMMRVRRLRSGQCEEGWVESSSSALEAVQPDEYIIETHLEALTQHSFGGSFSAGSTSIFASKYAFFNGFRDLQEKHLLANKFCKISPKICKISIKNRKILKRLVSCQKISQK